MRMEIFGDGCRKCRQLEENARQVMVETDEKIELFTGSDPERIAAYGLLALPALVIDGKVASSGSVLSAAEIKRLLEE